jgi:hypothetical protein
MLPGGYPGLAAEFLAGADLRGDISYEARRGQRPEEYAQLDALQGIGYAMLAGQGRARDLADAGIAVASDLSATAKELAGLAGRLPGRDPWADGELAAVRGELARVDGKCATLTAIATGAAAFAGTQLHTAPVAGRAVLAAAVAVFTAAVVVLLLAVRPRLGTAGWCRYLTMRADQVTAVTRGDGTWWFPLGRCAGPADFTAIDLGALAWIARDKYVRIRWGADLVIAGTVLLAAGLLAGAVIA